MTGYQLASTASQADAHRFTNKWTDVFRGDTPIHLFIMAAITLATFQGYLKDRIGGPVPYVLADLSFIAAAIYWFGGLALRHAALRGPGYTASLILGLVIVPTLYLLHPATPFVIEIAGLRAWSAYPVAALMALTAVRSRGQVEAYVRLILLLSVVTALYGIRQYIQGPDIALGTDLGQLRHGTTVFYDIAGSAHRDFRAFSTFTFPAPFAGMMVFGMLLATGIATSKFFRWKTRIIVALTVPLLFVGMTVSGTRAAVVILLLGLLLIGAFRGLGVAQLLFIPLLIGALHIGTLLTAGRMIERYGTLLFQEGLVWRYVSTPLVIAWEVLKENPFGLGLGRTGTGVPFRIVQSYPPDYFVFSDGDAGRAAAEMGIFGIVILGIVLFALLPHAWRATKALIGTENEGLAIGAGALVVSTGVLLLIGSPLSTAPHGMIWWFLFGAILKLRMLHDDASTHSS